MKLILVQEGILQTLRRSLTGIRDFFHRRPHAGVDPSLRQARLGRMRLLSGRKSLRGIKAKMLLQRRSSGGLRKQNAQTMLDVLRRKLR